MLATSEKWFVTEELTDEQLKIKNMSIENSYVVKGCAGSGKTILAIYRALEILSAGQDCKIIVYTSVLKRFIEDALSQHPISAEIVTQGIVTTHYKWVEDGMPSVSHLIVDEAQDFTAAEIESFFNAKTVSITLFGDTAQKLYKTKTVRDAEGNEHQVATLDIEEIASIHGIGLRSLKKNHRLPKKVARFAKHLSGRGESLEDVCEREGEKKPAILKCKNTHEEISIILALMKSSGLKDVGILLPDNDGARFVFEELLKRKIPCEVKYSDKKDWTNGKNTIRFNTDNPKIVTYHSAKGIQFKHVFIPFCSLGNSKAIPGTLYVACTRASEDITITYSNGMHSILNTIPNHLYDHQDFSK